MERIPSGVVSFLAGLAAFVVGYLSLFPTGCNENEGPSWERCVTVLGNPAFSLSDFGLPNQADIVIPLLLAVLVAAVAWFLARRARY